MCLYVLSVLVKKKKTVPKDIIFVFTLGRLLYQIFALGGVFGAMSEITIMYITREIVFHYNFYALEVKYFVLCLFIYIYPVRSDLYH